MNYFIGRSQEWLEKQLAARQQELAAGKTVTSVTAGDTSAAKTTQLSIIECIRMLLQALSLLDVATYPVASITPITETRVIFQPTPSSVL